MGGILTRVVPKTGGDGGFGTPASSFGSPIGCPGPRAPPENRPGAGDLKKTRLFHGSPALWPIVIVSGNNGGRSGTRLLFLRQIPTPNRAPRAPRFARQRVVPFVIIISWSAGAIDDSQTNSPNKLAKQNSPPPQRAREEAGGGGARAPPRGTAPPPSPPRPRPHAASTGARGSGGTLRERAAERRIAKDLGASRTAGGWGAAAVALSAAAAAGRPPNLL